MKFTKSLIPLLVLIAIVACDHDCGTPAECYVKAIELLNRDRAEIREKIDKLNENFEKTIKKDTQRELARVVNPIGTIIFHSHSKQTLGDNDLPAGWTICDGRALLRKDYSELFKTIGVLYGKGDGYNSFNLPDLRGRTIIGSGQGNELSSHRIGQTGGTETHILAAAEMPSHQHRQGSESLYAFYGGVQGGFK